MPESTSSAARMFVPPYYAARDARAIARRYPFGTLITSSAAGLHATALPFVFETDEPGEQRLVSHLAGRNGHAATLFSGQQALVLFNGPNSYVSAAHYHDKPQVPTWNYVAAQVRGPLQLLATRADRLRVLERTVAVMERDRSERWTMDQAPSGMVDKLLDLITAFRLEIVSIEGAEKLSQAHPQADRLRVIAGLLREDGAGAADIARLMADLPHPDGSR